MLIIYLTKSTRKPRKRMQTQVDEKRDVYFNDALEILEYNIAKADTDNECLPRAHLNCRTGAPSANTVYHAFTVHYGPCDPFSSHIRLLKVDSDQGEILPPDHAKYRRRPLGQDLHSSHTLARVRDMSHTCPTFMDRVSNNIIQTLSRRATDITTDEFVARGSSRTYRRTPVFQ